MNTRYGLLVCIHDSCGLVLSNQAEHHLNRYHGKPTENFLNLVNQLRQLHPEHPLPADHTPIQGILTFQGFKCLDCLPDRTFFQASEKRIKEHCKQMHQPRGSYETCFIQRRRFRERFEVVFHFTLISPPPPPPHFSS